MSPRCLQRGRLPRLPTKVSSGAVIVADRGLVCPEYGAVRCGGAGHVMAAAPWSSAAEKVVAACDGMNAGKMGSWLPPDRCRRIGAGWFIGSKLGKSGPVRLL